MLESASTTHSINTKARRKIFTHTQQKQQLLLALFYLGYRRWQQHRSTGSFHFCYCQSYRTYPLPWRQSAKTNPIAFTYTILLIQRLEMRERDSMSIWTKCIAADSPTKGNETEKKKQQNKT